jgi:YggT family protein
MIQAVFWLVEEVIRIYIWVMIAAAIFSWLEVFGVLDTRSRVVYVIGDFLDRLTTPVLAPVRRFIPSMGGIDISFIVVFLVLQALLIFLNGLYGQILMAGYS